MYVLDSLNPRIDLLLKYCLGSGAWGRGTYSVILLGLLCTTTRWSGPGMWEPYTVRTFLSVKASPCTWPWVDEESHTTHNSQRLKPFFSNVPVPKQGLQLAPIWRKWSKPCHLEVEKSPPCLYRKPQSRGGMEVGWPASPSWSDTNKLYLQIPDPKFPQVAKQKRQSTPSSPLWKQCAVTLITVSKQSVFAWKEAA